MFSGKTVKLVLYEVLQYAALFVPVFVIMERFAQVIRHIRGWDTTAYWLIVAASIAYVTSATLLVWVPLKYAILKQRRFITEITQWRPTALAYLILSTLPCFAIIMAGSKVQVDCKQRFDTFTELSVSLMLFSLICTDIIERIRPCKLRGKSESPDDDLDVSSPVFTHLEQVSTISVQVQADEGQNGLSQTHPEVKNGSISSRRQDRADTGRSPRPPSTSYPYYSPAQTWTYSGPLRILWRKDRRSEIFVESFLFWFDTVEMVRVAGEPSVFFSAWVFPIYIFAFLSALRMMVTPHSPLLSFTGVVLQEFPFFIIRLALISVFGYVTPVLYPLKNLLVTLTYVYFTLLSNLKIFKRRSMF